MTTALPAQLGGCRCSGRTTRRTRTLGLLLAALLAPFAAWLLQLAWSRTREYDADRTGAALVGDGRALASALAKIDAAVRRTPMHVEPAQASKYPWSPADRPFNSAGGSSARTPGAGADRAAPASRIWSVR